MAPLPIDESATEAGHGDAQSDIMGGTTLASMVMFASAMSLVIIFLVLFKQITAESQAAQQRAHAAEQALKQITSKNLTAAQIDKIVNGSKIEEENERLKKQFREAQERERRKTEILEQQQNENRSLKETVARLTKEVEKAKEPLKFVSAGMRLWIFPGGETFITDQEVGADGKWHQHYACHKAERTIPSGGSGSGVQDYTLTR